MVYHTASLGFLDPTLEQGQPRLAVRSVALEQNTARARPLTVLPNRNPPSIALNGSIGCPTPTLDSYTESLPIATGKMILHTEMNQSSCRLGFAQGYYYEAETTTVALRIDKDPTPKGSPGAG